MNRIWEAVSTPDPPTYVGGYMNRICGAVLDGGPRLRRGLTNPWPLKSSQGSTETEQIKSGPLCGLSRPTKAQD